MATVLDSTDSRLYFLKIDTVWNYEAIAHVVSSQLHFKNQKQETLRILVYLLSVI